MTTLLGQWEEGVFRKGLFTERQVQRKVRLCPDRGSGSRGRGPALEGRELSLRVSQRSSLGGAQTLARGGLAKVTLNGRAKETLAACSLSPPPPTGGSALAEPPPGMPKCKGSLWSATGTRKGVQG